jgi:HK97 family phage major capsid protein
MKTIAVLESETQATVARVRNEIAVIRERAASEQRAETAEERAQIDTLIREANSAKAALDRRRTDDALHGVMESLNAGVLPASIPRYAGVVPPVAPMASIGAQFTRPFAEWWRESRNERGQRWESKTLEVPYAALFAATITSDPASGGDLVIPDFRPGIIPSSTRRLVVADLIAPGTTTSNLITYMVEKTYTNAADTVAEGAAKPESTIVFDAVSDPVRKIAHWLPVTEEMLEDVPQLGSYIDSRLRHGVQLAEDDQLLNGTTTAPDIVGIRNRVGLAPALPRGTDSVADAIAKQIAAIQNATGVAPDGIVMNPTDFLGVALSKTSTGEYLGGSPFERVVAPSLWNVPVAVTSAMTAGIALVGAFRTAAQVFRKGGIRIAATNSHENYWILNKVAIRAELRESLAVYRPACFGEVTGLAPTP